MTALLTLQLVTPDKITVLSDAGNNAYRHHFTGYRDSVAELNTYLNNEYHPEPLQQSLATPGIFWFFICADEKIIGFCKLTENSRIDADGNNKKAVTDDGIQTRGLRASGTKTNQPGHICLIPNF